MLFGKLMMQRPNILIMEEPTHHLVMESIDTLNMALELYHCTLIFSSPHRALVTPPPTRFFYISLL